MTSTERVDGVHVLQLGNGPNTISEDLLAAIEAALDQVEADPGALGLVTVGGGKAYSQGYDLELLGRLEGGALQAFIDRSVRLLARLLVLPVPTVAAVNGHAFGYGAMFALAHDLRVQREDRGWFCLPEVDLGLQFHPLQLALIQARLSPAAVNEAILAGRRFDGPAAHQAGIADQVALGDELVGAAVAMAAARGGKPTAIVGALKRDLYAGVLAHTPG